jgi:hypothetical protein
MTPLRVANYWSRVVASGNSVGPNGDRDAVPEVLDNTAVGSRKPRLSRGKARQPLSAIVHDLCNLRSIRGDQEVVIGEFQGVTGEDRKTSGETGRNYWLLLTEMHVSCRPFASISSEL